MAQVIADRYEVEEMVGTGGMSRVYRARDRSLERVVALKVLHDEYAHDGDYVERFQREARAVARLAHPNIVTVIDRGEDTDGSPFIVFEYVRGENLRERMLRCGPLPIRDLLELGLQVAHGLAFAHQQGLVHRDVKPQNVIVNGEDGRAQVTDFGIARSLDVERGTTQPGTVLGTSMYISPEQARGEQVEAASDIYSLGAVLFELLTGRPPFEGDSFVAVAMQHVNAPVPSILERRPDCPPRLARAIERALAKRPEQRFATMEELAVELEACLAELASPPDLDATLVGAVPQMGPYVPHAHRRRRAWPLVALGLLVLIAVLGGVAYLLRGTPSAAPKAGAAASAGPIALSGAGALDPFGSDHWEHPDQAAQATDGSASTYWYTQTYRDGLAKPGVGLVVRSAHPAALRTLTLDTPTPGFTAVVRTATGADGAESPGPADSPAQTVAAHTVFHLRGLRSSYWVVWITDLGGLGQARIAEVHATS